MYKKFYHSTTRKMIAAFSTVFDNIHIDVNNKDIKVPLHYSQGEKFIQKLAKYPDLENTVKPVAMPVMGFELLSMQYDPERHTNVLNKIQDRQMQQNKEYMYNRSPVSWNFEMYIGVKRIGDGLQIIEQIIPFFQPHLNLTVKGIDSFERPDNIQLILTSFSHQVDTDGTMDEPRFILFQLSFTLKGYLYQDIRKHATITENIIRLQAMNDTDFDTKFIEVAEQVEVKND